MYATTAKRRRRSNDVNVLLDDDEKTTTTPPLAPPSSQLSINNNNNNNNNDAPPASSAISATTAALISMRKNPTRKAIYCNIADWTNREMVIREKRMSLKRRRVHHDGSGVDDTSISTRRTAMKSSSSSSASSTTVSGNDNDNNGGGGNGGEYLFTRDDLSRIRELKNRRYHGAGQHSDDALNRQLAEYKKSSNLSRMFAKLTVHRPTKPKCRYILDRLTRMVQRRDRPLTCRQDRMLAAYHDHLSMYRQICPEFMDHLLRVNVMPHVPEQHSKKSPLTLILLHLINATPSVTLSQFYFYVFGKNFCFGEVCEFFMNVCDYVVDALFAQRTRFIIQRYQRLGDGRAIAILDKMCVCEMVLFPMLMRHKELDDKLELLTATNGAKLLQNGACVAADELYGQLYNRTDVLELAFEFVYERAVTKRRAVTATAAAAAAAKCDPFDELLKSRRVLELANFLHWRYDGTTYLDPANNDLVIPRNNDVLAKYICAKYLSFIKERKSTNDVSVVVDEEAAAAATTSTAATTKGNKKNGGTGGGGGKNSEMSAATFRTRMIEVMDLVAESYRGSTLGGIANSHTGDSNENVSQESGQTTVVGGLTLDKFVRYMDKRTVHHIVLNLYLNRFELSTPAMSRVLMINYDSGNPPQRYRFNEVCDRDVNRYVHSAVNSVNSYFENTCSRDTINHYLYSNVIFERVHEKTQRKRKRRNENLTPTSMRNDGDNDYNDNDDDDDEYETTATTSIMRQYDKPFTCEVADLVNLLPQMLSQQDARNILLHSHPFARIFTIILLNMAHSFDEDMLQSADSVRRVMSVLVESSSQQHAFLSSVSANLLYAPLGCRSYLDDDESKVDGRFTVERIARDVFAECRRFLRRCRRRDGNGAAHDEDNCDDAVAAPVSSSQTDNKQQRLRREDTVSAATVRITDTERLRHELEQRSLKLGRLSDSDDSSSSSDSSDDDGGGEEDDVEEKETATAEKKCRSKIKDLVPTSTTYFVIPPAPSRRQQRQRQTARGASCPDAMRNYCASWRLHEFARDHANDPTLERWISAAAARAKKETAERRDDDLLGDISGGGGGRPDIDSSSSTTTSGGGAVIVNIAAAFLFLLVRERERRTMFLVEDGNGRFVDCLTESKDRSKPESRLNNFARLTDTRCSLFDECYVSLCRMYPECNIHSYDTNSLANGLTVYMTSRPEGRNVPNDIAYALSIAIVSLHIFARGDRDVLLFFLGFITSIRFPGQFLKSILLLQGTSDSGKSEFVSEVLRAIFSCVLNGTLSNSTLRQGVKDEVNTDLMSMMRSHICQVDEPERINSELFKNLLSMTMMRGRFFKQQQSQYLRNLAKIILTVNDAIILRSDAGVITRLKLCLRMVHRFKSLHNRHFDTTVDFTKNNATPSICYQFATRCFAKGVNFPDFRVGLFLTMEHYGVDMCTYNEATYALYDAVSGRLADVERHCCELRERQQLTNESKNRLKTFKNDLMLFRKMLTYNLTDRVIRMYTAAMHHNRRRHRVASAIAAAVDDDDEAAEKEEDEENFSSSSSDDDDDDAEKEEDGGNDNNDGRTTHRQEIIVDIANVMLPSALPDITHHSIRENKVAKKMRFDAVMRNRSVKIFRDTAGTTLDDPVPMDELPEAMMRDAHNLHVMLDPFESLLQQYRIYEDSTVSMRDRDLYRFLREFVEQSGYLVSRTNFREIVVKIKERIKTDYPNSFDDKTQTFHLTFAPKRR